MTVNKIISLAMLLTIVSGTTSRAQRSVAICPDAIITLQALSTEAASYQWYRNGILINNRIQDTLMVADSGSYEAKAVSLAGCLSDNSTVIDVFFQYPIALNDTFEFQTELLLDVWTNDTATCSPFDLASLQIISPPLHGNLNMLPDGVLQYVFENNYIGLDSFLYSWQDLSGRSSNVATVYLNNDNPLSVISLDFYAHKINRQAKLLWNGFEGQEGMRYEVAKSPDGLLWENLVQQHFPGPYAAGQAFTQFDLTPYTGGNIYRLQVFTDNNQLRHTAYRELFFNSLLQVYPNPTDDMITVELDKDLVQELALTDIQGRVLWKKTHPESQERLGLSKYAASVYFLRAISTAGTAEVIKIDRR